MKKKVSPKQVLHSALGLARGFYKLRISDETRAKARFIRRQFNKTVRKHKLKRFVAEMEKVRRNAV